MKPSEHHRCRVRAVGTGRFSAACGRSGPPHLSDELLKGRLSTLSEHRITVAVLPLRSSHTVARSPAVAPVHQGHYPPTRCRDAPAG